MDKIDFQNGVTKLNKSTLDIFQENISNAIDIEKNINENQSTAILKLQNESGSTINVTMNENTYVLTIDLLNADGDVVSSKSIDLPLEEMIISASYDKATKELILSLKNGQEIKIPLSDMVEGLAKQEDINKLTEENSKLKERITDLESNQLKGSAEGESITVNDSADYKCDIGLYGNYEQETTEGKQLFKDIAPLTRNGVTFSRGDDGAYILNGTATATASFYLTDIGYSAGTYTLSLNNNTVLNAASYTQLETSSGTKRVAFSAANNKGTFECDDINALSIVISSGTVLKNFKFYPMLVLGTDQKSYEPYTGGIASPNPDYPQEIEVVSGLQKVKVQNENYMECNVESSTNDGIAFEYDSENDIYILNGTSTKNTNVPLTLNLSKKLLENIKKGETYTIAIKRISGTNSNGSINFTNRVYENDSSIWTWTTNLTPSLNEQKRSRTFNYDNAYVDQVRLYITTGVTCNNLKLKLEIVKGNSNYNFIPHQSQEYDLLLSSENMLNPDDLVLFNSNQYLSTKDYNTKGTIPVKSSTNYCLSLQGTLTDSGAITNWGADRNIYLYDKNGTQTTTKGAILTENGIKTIRFSTNSDTVSVGFYTSLSKAFDNIETLKVMLNEGDTSLDYTPYTPQQLELFDGDTIRKENGKWWKIGEYTKLVLTGDIGVNVEGIYDGIYQVSINETYKKNNWSNDSVIRAYSTHFKGVGFSNSWTKDNSITSTGTSTRIMTSLYSTITAFKAYLKEQYDARTPVIVYFQSVTPTKTEITSPILIEQLEKLENEARTYKGLTHIDTDTGLAYLTLDYNKSLPIVIDNITNAIVSTGANL